MRIPFPEIALRAFSRQLGSPSGPLGGVVARILNKGNRTATESAVKALDLKGDEVVADMGFGGGVGLQLLLAASPHGNVLGIEPSGDMLSRARRTFGEAVAAGRLVLHEATMSSLPVADGELDGWISLNTIYFIPELEPAFAELSRVLAPDGRGVLGIADPDWMASQPFVKQNFLLRSVDDVIGQLQEAGFAVERIELDRDGSLYNLLVCTH
ncbi:class I SAM-dependent methyltransferase [Nocardioides sp. NPDC057772]|uniref:class I SAM-dependent methyltransferase n=1 Tax=unclassified Nocardioides TaxID=2615069 RepID=UPI002E1A6455